VEAIKDKGYSGDAMTPRERMAAFASGGDLDRLPFILHIGEHASCLIGVSVARYSNDPKLMAEAQFDVFQDYGPDSAGVARASSASPRPWAPNLNFRRTGCLISAERLSVMNLTLRALIL